MKKIISVLTVIVLTLSMLISVNAVTERLIGKRGDVNFDDTVDVIDVVILRSHIVGSINLSGDAFILGDMNIDNNIDVIDVVMLRNIIVSGLDTEYVYETLDEPSKPSDTDTDYETETDSDTETEIATDTSVETETETETADTNTDTDTNTETDTETDTDTDIETDTNTDTDTDTYTDTESLDEGIYLKTSYAVTTYSNVNIQDRTVTITEPGVYLVYGDITDGQIIVDVDKTIYPEDKVEIELNGVTMTNTSDSPIYVASVGDECVISVKKGTTNTISDGSDYQNADGKSAAIYSCDDLKIKGKGTLVVNGNCDEGIACKNDIKIWNGDIRVTAVGDAIRGKDSVRIGDPDDTNYDNLSVTVKSVNEDAIKSTNAEDESKGYITINGGTVNVTSKYDGIKAEQALTVNGGDITIYTYSGYTSSNVTGDSDSAKALKCVGLYDTQGNYLSAGTIDLNGGTITVNSSDDAVHCSGTLTVDGAIMNIKTGDDGLHSDTNLYIKSGLVEILNSYEGVEASNIYMQGGTVYVVSSDDGFNAAGGNDGSGTQGPGGWNQGGRPGSMAPGSSMPGASSSGNYMMSISGGYVIVNAQGDGLDSNGSLEITGGTTVVYGTTAGGNGIIDIGDGGNCTFTVSSDAVLFGVGTKDMFVSPTSGNYIKSTTLSASANEYVAIKDSAGNILSIIKTPKNAQALIYVNGNTTVSSCSIYKGGTYSGTVDAYGYATGGTLSGAATVSKS